jgi:hypothetical protein
MDPSPTPLEMPEPDAPPLEPDVSEAPPEAVASEVSPLPAGPFSSLYQTFGGTLTAVALGLLIIVGIQIIVGRIFGGKRTMSDSLTTFATAMVAVLVGIYVCDLLIAGPEVTLLRESERTTIVTFIKDISLMCFSYYFGSKTFKEPKEPVT